VIVFDCAGIRLQTRLQLVVPFLRARRWAFV